MMMLRYYVTNSSVANTKPPHNLQNNLQNNLLPNNLQHNLPEQPTEQQPTTEQPTEQPTTQQQTKSNLLLENLPPKTQLQNSLPLNNLQQNQIDLINANTLNYTKKSSIQTEVAIVENYFVPIQQPTTNNNNNRTTIYNTSEMP